ncbi:MAG: DUF1003 domain-containing protein [Mucilaginibacter sp.]|nr:DUF1003 domain-containing protein [Mucilaginibacter sp.]
MRSQLTAMEQDSRNTKIRSAIDIRQTWLDRAAVAITDLFGSIGFLVFCLLLLGFYITWNLGWLPVLQPFDPFPFNGLDSVLSIFAIILSVCVLISQKRQRRIEKVREQLEFEINIKAETEITKILEMLHEIQKTMGIDKKDPELEEMKETTDIQQLHRQIDENHLE